MSNHPSGFTGWTHVGNDAWIEVTHGQGGVEDVRVIFRTPSSSFAVPELYLAQDKARELRDALSQVLREIDFQVPANVVLGGE